MNDRCANCNNLKPISGIHNWCLQGDINEGCANYAERPTPTITTTSEGIYVAHKKEEKQ